MSGDRSAGGTARAATSKVVVVLPAYNAEKTLERTCAEIPRDVVDEILLVDDASRDRTVEVARRLGIPTLVHPANRGYGANQKSCYRAALERGADIVVMLHPDYQYPPQLIPAMVALLRSGMYDVVLGSRVLVRGALKGGMPLYKYIGNRVLTMFENLVIGRKLSEYHTGYRAFRREVLETLPIEVNADGFVFDNQMLCQAIYHGFSVGEISSPCRYFPEASSIGPLSSLRYAAGVVRTALQFRLNRWGLLRSRLFERAAAPIANSRLRAQVGTSQVLQESLLDGDGVLPGDRSGLTDTVMPPQPQTTVRFLAGLALTALLAIAVPATWYAAHGAFWAPSHDDMVSLLLSSEGKSRADLVLSPTLTTRRSIREILGTIEPQARYGVLDTVLDVYRLSINPPVYLGLLNLWRRILGKSFPAAMMLSVLACALSSCALYWIVARERGWLSGLLVSALFCFSPTYWEAALATRQYALSALLSSCLVGSVAVLLRTGRPVSFRPAAALVAAGTLMTLTAYQSVVLMLSLLAGFIAVATLRKDRRLTAVAWTAAVAFAIASAPILLLARWQGVRGGHLGVPVNTLLPFGSPAETWGAALQLALSLFVDLPYAHVPFAGLVLAVLALLGSLALIAAKEAPAPAAATLLAVSFTSGIALYAALVLLGQVPAWFALRYFVAYSCAYLLLLGLVEIPDPRVDRIRRVVLGLLLVVSSGTFILRTGQYVGSGRQEEYSAFQDLRRAHTVLTDSRQHAMVLRIAAHASPEANVWLVRLPIDQAACRAIADDGRGGGVAVMWARESDREAFETALRSCLPDMQEGRVIAHSWLDLKIWKPRGQRPAGGT